MLMPSNPQQSLSWMTSTEAEGREKNYGRKSAFFSQYPSMFGKVQWRFRGAMTGSHMLMHLRVNGEKKH